MSIYKIVGVCILCVCACILFKKLKEEYALFISAAVSLFILAASLSIALPLFDYLKELGGSLGYEPYIEIVMKCCAVAVLCGFASDIAKDFGENAIASKIELIGKCTIMLYSLPLIKSLINGALEFI